MTTLGANENGLLCHILFSFEKEKFLYTRLEEMEVSHLSLLFQQHDDGDVQSQVRIVPIPSLLDTNSSIIKFISILSIGSLSSSPKGKFLHQTFVSFVYRQNVSNKPKSISRSSSSSSSSLLVIRCNSSSQSSA
ncbi:hypothetical protein SSS_02763 [Sarcoptes scabiei]|uniref:Uncharacterized protein n=1 Tax=Sarcoptes scabiei TaxID=52283 RepID=A0A834R2S8_SARSC|nr:hypothetical protein SSS_02763 [Sarcoptes scabiei]